MVNKQGGIDMYRKVEGNLRMKRSEAFARFPDHYMLVQKENRDLFDPLGTVLYIGDDYYELFALGNTLNLHLGIVYEGNNLQNDLGGIELGV
jgi:hypothetical protein